VAEAVGKASGEAELQVRLARVIADRAEREENEARIRDSKRRLNAGQCHSGTQVPKQPFTEASAIFLILAVVPVGFLLFINT
jgi:hypothetical protein